MVSWSRKIPATTAMRALPPPLRRWPTRRSSPAVSWPWCCLVRSQRARPGGPSARCFQSKYIGLDRCSALPLMASICPFRQIRHGGVPGYCPQAQGRAEAPDKEASFTSFSHRPQGVRPRKLAGGRVGRQASVRRIEDGPYDGTQLMVGEELAGKTITTPRS